MEMNYKVRKQAVLDLLESFRAVLEADALQVPSREKLDALGQVESKLEEVLYSMPMQFLMSEMNEDR